MRKTVHKFYAQKWIELILKLNIDNIHNNLENRSPRVQSCRELLNRIQINVAFQWVLPHYDLWGNKMADLRQKRAQILSKGLLETYLFTLISLKSIGFIKKCFQSAAICATKNKS